MADILFVTWDGGGNVPPALGIATQLQARGHAVRFVGHSALADRIASAGLDFTPFPTARPVRAADGASPLQLVATFGDRAMGRDVLADLSARPADLVVVDCLLFGVMRELRRAGLSYAVLEHTFDGYVRRAAKGPLGLLLRLRGLRTLGLIDSGDPTIVASLPELDRGHGSVVHTGPVVPGVPATPEAPTVLVSLSTFSFPALQATWQRVLDAVDGLPARVLATVGPAVDQASLRVPANVEVHRWLPHDEVLPQVSLVVGHGGHATTMAALAHGVPLLVLPVDDKTDQRFVGAALERAGVGRTLSRRAPAGRIRAAIDELLAAGPHHQAAADLGRRIRELDGAARAADLLESTVRSRAAQQ